MSLIQWFPGHMAKTKRIIQEQLKLVDVVIEILDARIPRSSRNPLLDKLIKDKQRLIILNKSDLADDNVTKEWMEYFDKFDDTKAISLNSTESKKNILNLIKASLIDITKEKRERKLKKGIKNITTRTMIVGIPNVGKSTFINALVGKKSMKTGNKPGVTRGQQWIKLAEGLDLMDTPGILWPKFEDQQIAANLALTGAIKDELIDFENMGIKLLEFLQENYGKNLVERYNIEETDLKKTPLELLEKMAEKRGCLLPGKRYDYLKITTIIINEFRKGLIGKVSLEKPE